MVISILKTFFNDGIKIFNRGWDDLAVTDRTGEDQIDDAAGPLFVGKGIMSNLLRCASGADGETKLGQARQDPMRIGTF